MPAPSLVRNPADLRPGAPAPDACSWTLACPACDYAQSGAEQASVCPRCGQPLFARYAAVGGRDRITSRTDMWRYGPLMPLAPGEEPVSLGEGCTPLTEFPHLARELDVARLWVKNEAVSPTTSFKARGMSAAVTRARSLGARGLTVPTNGNAGAALAAYAAAADLPARIYGPRVMPAPIQRQIRALGAELVLVDGHIGDAGREARAYAAEAGWFDVSTLREPYRLEGKKTMGIEVAEQLGWQLPDAIIFPTGGGIAIIGMWKAFAELRAAGWLDPALPLPRMLLAQSTGCAPLVEAWHARADRAQAWPDPETHATGLRVPAPLGDRLILRVLRESDGDAIAVSESDIREGTGRLSRRTGIDACPEGGAALAGLDPFRRAGRLSRDASVVLFNTGSGALYR